MVFRVIRCIFVYVFLITLKLCVDHVAFVVCSDCTPIKLKYDLSVTCGLSQTDASLSNITSYCTALAVSDDSVNLQNIKTMAGKRPIVYIEKINSMDEWLNILVKNATTYTNEVMVFGTTVVVFDGLENLQLDSSSGVSITDFQTGVQNFFINAKSLNKLLFGIVLPNNITEQTDIIQIANIKQYVDFFILNTTVYRQCDYHDDQEDMIPVANLDDIEQTVKNVLYMGIDQCQMMIIIQLQVFSVKYHHFSDNESEDMTYSTLCTKQMDSDRKYCFNSIADLYNQAEYAYGQNMIGVYVSTVNEDDYNGSCKCNLKDDAATTFPALRIISQVHNNQNLTLNHFSCSNGDFPTIL